MDYCFYSFTEIQVLFVLNSDGQVFKQQPENRYKLVVYASGYARYTREPNDFKAVNAEIKKMDNTYEMTHIYIYSTL